MDAANSHIRAIFGPRGNALSPYEPYRPQPPVSSTPWKMSLAYITESITAASTSQAQIEGTFLTDNVTSSTGTITSSATSSTANATSSTGTVGLEVGKADERITRVETPPVLPWAKVYQPGKLGELGLEVGKFDDDSTHVETPHGKVPRPGKPRNWNWLLYTVLARIPGGTATKDVLKKMCIEWDPDLKKREEDNKSASNDQSCRCALANPRGKGTAHPQLVFTQEQKPFWIITDKTHQKKVAGKGGRYEKGSTKDNSILEADRVKSGGLSKKERKKAEESKAGSSTGPESKRKTASTSPYTDSEQPEEARHPGTNLHFPVTQGHPAQDVPCSSLLPTLPNPGSGASQGLPAHVAPSRLSIPDPFSSPRKPLPDGPLKPQPVSKAPSMWTAVNNQVPTSTATTEQSKSGTKRKSDERSCQKDTKRRCRDYYEAGFRLPNVRKATKLLLQVDLL